MKPKKVTDLIGVLNALREAELTIKVQNHGNCLVSVVSAIEYIRGLIEKERNTKGKGEKTT